MAVVFAREVGTDVCVALGLDPAVVRSVRINFDANEVVTADVEIYPDGPQVDGVLSVIRRYNLVPIDDEDEVA